MKNAKRTVSLMVMGLILALGSLSSASQGSQMGRDDAHLANQLEGRWQLLNRFCNRDLGAPNDYIYDIDIEFTQGILVTVVTVIGEDGIKRSMEQAAPYAVRQGQLVLTNGAEVSESVGSIVVAQTEGRGTRLYVVSNTEFEDGGSCESGDTLTTILLKQ